MIDEVGFLVMLSSLTPCRVVVIISFGLFAGQEGIVHICGSAFQRVPE